MPFVDCQLIILNHNTKGTNAGSEKGSCDVTGVLRNVLSVYEQKQGVSFRDSKMDSFSESSS